MAVDPKLRSAGLHFGTATAAALATAMWMSSHSVDLYAIMNQFNSVVVEIGKLAALVAALATAATQVWKSTTPALVADVNEIAKQPETPIQAVITTDTDEGHALANSLPGPVVAAGTPEALAIVKS